jgi:hypothetical protein
MKVGNQLAEQFMEILQEDKHALGNFLLRFEFRVILPQDIEIFHAPIPKNVNFLSQIIFLFHGFSFFLALLNPTGVRAASKTRRLPSSAVLLSCEDFETSQGPPQCILRVHST